MNTKIWTNEKRKKEKMRSVLPYWAWLEPMELWVFPSSGVLRLFGMITGAYRNKKELLGKSMSSRDSLILCDTSRILASRILAMSIDSW